MTDELTAARKRIDDLSKELATERAAHEKTREAADLAVDMERELCAQVALGEHLLPIAPGGTKQQHGAALAHVIAAAIRARSKP